MKTYNIDSQRTIDIVKNHEDAGIRVLCVLTNKLANELVRDFIIFDSRKLLIEDLHKGVDSYIRAEVSVNPHTVREWEDRFDFIENQAMPPGQFFSKYP